MNRGGFHADRFCMEAFCCIWYPCHIRMFCMRFYAYICVKTSALYLGEVLLWKNVRSICTKLPKNGKKTKKRSRKICLTSLAKFDKILYHNLTVLLKILIILGRNRQYSDALPTVWKGRSNNQIHKKVRKM